MFSAQDLLDIAIRLEKNGEKTYCDAQRQTKDPQMNTLLGWAAQEECSHARWFASLKERMIRGEDHHLEAELSRALVEDVVQGQTFSLQEVDFAALDTPEKMIRTFIGFEADTIAFYEILQALISDPEVAGQLEAIIAEERNHMAQFRALLAG